MELHAGCINNSLDTRRDLYANEFTEGWIEGEDTTGTHDLGQLYEALSLLSADPTDPGISSRNFSNVVVWSFDCSLAGTNALDPIVEQTQIELTMQLDQALNHRRTVFILSYTPSVIEISSARTVQTDM